jgi:hypothetical protein
LASNITERMQDKGLYFLEIRGWINGSMSAPTKEVSGFLPIPEEIKLKLAMQPMTLEPPGEKSHW